ncbi:MAG: SMI1/KNR4 family protein [Bacteroidetes bacterium]|nr:SMI1/KNR4 family protein [Bacteroidota bacterium]
MEITYLQKLKNNPTIFSESIRGVSETEIAAYEKKLKVKFPKSYKEYLFLAGDYDGDLLMLRGYSGIRELGNPAFQEHLEAVKKKAGVKIKRPYWVFTGEEDCFDFFYLDENTENPNVYTCEWAFGTAEVESLNQTFSDYIDNVIDDSKAHYKGLYG